MKVDREQVTAAITTAQSAARSEEIAATTETLRWARCAGPDAVRYLHFWFATTERLLRIARVRRWRFWTLVVFLACHRPSSSRALRFAS
jgi:hypothetical protein